MHGTTRALQVALWTLILGGGSLAARAADKPNMRAGTWEVVVTGELEGSTLAYGAVPSSTIHCVLPEDFENPFFVARLNLGSSRKCRSTDPKVEGDKMSYSFTCEGVSAGPRR
jgi:hypothetical protein